MRLLDSALSRGLLGDGDYMLRADALQQATSIEQMNTIVQQLPVLENLAKSRPTASGGSRRRRTDRQVEVPLISQGPDINPSPEMSPTLEMSPASEISPAPEKSHAPEIGKPLAPLTGSDDMKVLDPVDVAMLLKSAQVRKPSSNRRMQALAVVGILFLVLIVIGVLLAVHDRSVNGSNGLLQPHYLFVATTLIV
jgi:hypothetical protein